MGTLSSLVSSSPRSFQGATDLPRAPPPASLLLSCGGAMPSACVPASVVGGGQSLSVCRGPWEFYIGISLPFWCV